MWLASLAQVAAPSYARLIKRAISQSLVGPASYESLFPTSNTPPSSLFSLLATALFPLLENTPCLYSPNTSSFVPPSSAVLPPTPPPHSPVLSSLLSILSLPPSLPLVLPSSAPLHSFLLSSSTVPPSRTTTPTLVRSFFSRLDRASLPAYLTPERALVLLSHAASDLDPSSYPSLHGLPFLPLASSSLGTFSSLPPCPPPLVSQLRSMGFSGLAAAHALRRFGNDVDRAVEFLFESRAESKGEVRFGLDP